MSGDPLWFVSLKMLPLMLDWKMLARLLVALRPTSPSRITSFPHLVRSVALLYCQSLTMFMREPIWFQPHASQPTPRSLKICTARRELYLTIVVACQPNSPTTNGSPCAFIFVSSVATSYGAPIAERLLPTWSLFSSVRHWLYMWIEKTTL